MTKKKAIELSNEIGIKGINKEYVKVLEEKIERYERAFDLILKNSISGHIDNIIKKARDEK